MTGKRVTTCQWGRFESNDREAIIAPIEKGDTGSIHRATDGN